MACLVTIALTWSRSTGAERLASLDPTQTRAENVYATTNQGHIDDILDGWDQVRAHPITGLGVGVLYHGHAHGPLEGRRRDGAQRARSRSGSSSGSSGCSSFFARLLHPVPRHLAAAPRQRILRPPGVGRRRLPAGNFVVICTVYSWPFSTWEKCILIFTLIAMAYPPDWRALAQQPRESRTLRCSTTPMASQDIDLTVVTPSYGYAHYLRDAIESVAEQQGITVEHVIQDGESTDGTVELLSELDDLVDWVSEPDDGQSDALNRAIAARPRTVGGVAQRGRVLPARRPRGARAGRRPRPAPTSSTGTRSSPTARGG